MKGKAQGSGKGRLGREAHLNQQHQHFKRTESHITLAEALPMALNLDRTRAKAQKADMLTQRWPRWVLPHGSTGSTGCGCVEEEIDFRLG